MKKSTIAFIVGAFLLTPFISSASIIDDLRAQIISLTEAVLNLQIQIAAIVNSQPTSNNTASVTGLGSTSGSVISPETSSATGSTASSLSSGAYLLTSKVIVTFPDGGEVFFRGNKYTITWKGGSGTVYVALVKPTASSSIDPTGSLNQMVGWIANLDATNNSVVWDGSTVCGLEMSSCSQVAPGNYKILVVSQDANGNMTIWDNELNKAGNLDISNIAFTIR